MCLAARNLTPKSRRFLAIGNLCLAVGLLMSVFDKDVVLHHAAIYDGLRGLLIGLSLAFNFGALRMGANCRKTQP
ncbi:MAG TPA: hypothetical protein VGT08_15865 [Terracidiphilus sp.]|nr:hypothetical protein [Terracidiphilus sp.]